MMSKELEVLEKEWHTIVYTNEKAAYKAWREVDIKAILLGSYKEHEYYRNLIATAKLYISE